MRKIIYAISAAMLIYSAVCIIASGYAEEGAYFPPPAAFEEITEDRLSDADFIFSQTGLSAEGAARVGSVEELRRFQADYFRGVRLVSVRNSPISKEDLLADECGTVRNSGRILPLKNGDVLINFASRTDFGWRNGHAAIVVDEENGVTLESTVMGEKSRLRNAEDWLCFSNFAVLRCKDEKAAEKAAEYAREHLRGVEYGFFTQKAAECSRTNCSHLVFAAYLAAGVDLDSDGGVFVTPKDIFDSDKMTVLQVFGMEPQK